MYVLKLISIILKITISGVTRQGLPKYARLNQNLNLTHLNRNTW